MSFGLFRLVSVGKNFHPEVVLWVLVGCSVSGSWEGMVVASPVAFAVGQIAEISWG